MQGSFRRQNVLRGLCSVRLGGNGRRSPLDAPDLFFENGHLRTKRTELFFLDADGCQLFGFFIERGDVFFAFARLLQPGGTRLLTLLEQREARFYCGNAFFADLGVGFKARKRKLSLSFGGGIARIRAFDEPVAVCFKIEEAGNEFEPIRTGRTDELRKLSLRERDTFFEITLFQPDDAFQERIAFPDAVSCGKEHVVLSFVNFDALRRVFAPEFAFDPKDTAAAFKRDLEFKMDISPVKRKIDHVADAAGAGTRDAAVERKADTVQNGALPRSRIAENAEDPVFEKFGKVDMSGLGKGIDAAKF